MPGLELTLHGLFSASFLTADMAPQVSDEVKKAAWQFVDSGFEVLNPHSNSATYQNFIDPHRFFRFEQSVR